MMSSESDLLRLLDDEPRTPSTVDVRRAVADGRRQRRNRRAAGTAGAATLTVLVIAGVTVAAHRPAGTQEPQPPQVAASKTPKPKPAYTIPGTPGWTPAAATAPTACTLQQLPASGNAVMAIVGTGDATGRYLAGRSYPHGDGYAATVWHDGKATGVPLPGDSEQDLKGINSSGTAVGWSYKGDNPVPYAYVKGKVVKLPGVTDGEAQAINNAGAIVGVSSDRALVWPSATTKPFTLPLPAGTSTSTAASIDEDGTVAGTVGGDTPYVWFADGTHRALPMPTVNGKTAASAEVSTIRNGWATGSASMVTSGSGAPEGQRWPVRWNIRTGEVSVIPDLDIRPDAVNAQGWQIGTDLKGHAVLITDKSTVILPPITPPNGNDLSTIPNTISDDGRTIAGQSDDANGTIRPVLWKCH